MMPDAEHVVLTWLKEHPDVQAFAPRVDIRYGGTVPAVVVERVGGLADYLGVVDHPRIDVTAWGSTKPEAHDLAATCREVIHRINGQVVGTAVCGLVSEVMGLQYVPDDSTEGTPRYLFTVEITMRTNTVRA